MNNNEIKNDNEYMEFSNQMKEQYNELEAEKKLTEMENYELKKEIVTIYGLIRVLDTCLSDLHNIMSKYSEEEAYIEYLKKKEEKIEKKEYIIKKIEKIEKIILEIKEGLK